MINCFRKYALFLVVFIHSHLNMTYYFDVSVPSFLVNCYGYVLGYFHPASILAAISGYLLFKSFDCSDKNWRSSFNGKYIKRIYSLLIPYVFWISLFFIFNNLLIYFIRHFNTNVFVSEFNSLTPSNYIKSFFYPELALAKHLWYLNNLLFVFIIAPLLLVVSKNKPAFIILLFLIGLYYYLTYNRSASEHDIIIRYRFILFFVIGTFLGLNKNYFDFIAQHRLVLFMLFIGAFIVLNSSIYYNPDKGFLYLINNFIVNILVFLLFFILLKRFYKREATIYNKSNHFLLYIIHPIILSVLCKILLHTHIISINKYFVLLIICFVLTFLVVKINDFIYSFLNKKFAGFTRRFL